MYKIIACDLDGTLLRKDKSISEDTIHAIEKIVELGYIFVPATGRAHTELPVEILEKPFIKYGICINGAEIYDFVKDMCVYDESIPNKEALDLMEFTESLPVYPTLVIKGNRYMPSDENGIILPEIQKIALKSVMILSKGVPDIYKMLEKNGEDVQKFLYYPKDPQKIDEIIEIMQNNFPNLNICSSGPIQIEVNSKLANKGSGLIKLCEYLDVNLEDVIAFGDAANDIELFESAGYRIAMKNAIDKIKQIANVIAPDCDEDGVEQILREIMKGEFKFD